MTLRWPIRFRSWMFLLIGATGAVSFSALSAQDPQRTPGPEMRRMRPFLGGWRTEEKYHPTPWAPNGNTGKGYMTARWTLNGAFLNTEKHSTGVTGPYSGSGMFTYDKKIRAYRMWWFDSRGGGQEFTGRWDEATRSFILNTKSTDRLGKPVEKRVTYRLVNDKTIKFSLEYAYEPNKFKPYIESTYTKIN